VARGRRARVPARFCPFRDFRRPRAMATPVTDIPGEPGVVPGGRALRARRASRCPGPCAGTR